MTSNGSDDMGALQASINNAGGTWTAGYNSITALSESERRVRLGVPLPSPEQIQSLQAQSKAISQAPARAISAPASFDWRNVNGQNFVTAVKDQGGCGSCVAFGVCGAIETTFRRQRNDPNLAIDLSEAHLFYCYGRADGRSCGNGWFPGPALDHVQRTGVTDEACYPYTAGDQNCTGRCSDWENRVTKITGVGDLTNNPQSMKDWLSTTGALSACFIVYDDFFNYQSGVYHRVSNTVAGGHCVTIIGYNDSQGCWICKNSWGTGWGDQGFFRIGYGECGIETWFVHGVQGIVETGWLNQTLVEGLWAIDQQRNAWAYLQNVGWRKVAPTNDAIFVTMLSQLAVAKTTNRAINVYQEDSMIKEVYVL